VRNSGNLAWWRNIKSLQRMKSILCIVLRTEYYLPPARARADATPILRAPPLRFWRRAALATTLAASRECTGGPSAVLVASSGMVHILSMFVAKIVACCT